MENELFIEDFVIFDSEANTKEEVIAELAKQMENCNRLKDLDGYLADVKTREEQSSTALGMEIATPHSKSEHVLVPSLGFARLKNPIRWDDEDVTFVFLIAVPSPGQGDVHLKIISGLCRKLIYDEFKDELRNAADKSEIVKLIGEL